MLKNRFVVFGLFFAILMFLNYYFTQSLLPSPDTKNLWFYSGLFMMVFSILFIDPYYSSPKNVITNTIPLALTLIPIKDIFADTKIWWISFGVVITLLVAALISLVINDETKSENHVQNRLSVFLKNSVVLFGQGKVLYSLVFIASLLSYYSIQNDYTITLFFFWCGILLINPKSLTNTFSLTGKKLSTNAIGEVFSIQSKQVLLAKVFRDKTNVNKFDIVEFQYSTQDDHTVSIGFIFDTYFLNNEKWIKVLKLKNDIQQNADLNPNIIYKVSTQHNPHADLNIDKFVGVVVEGSNIENIRFEYSKQNENLEEGQLLVVAVGSKSIFYQVVEGITAIENLESKNESGFTCGEAIQLGEWQANQLSFIKYGWVPNINTPIFLAEQNFAINQYAYPEYQLGVIPGTNLPSVINLHDAVSHHMALIGVTGSGKSFLAREIINQLQTDTKVICIDFNNEFVTTLNPAPLPIINAATATQIATHIDWINNELDKFANQQDKPQIASRQENIKTLIKTEIDAFLDDQTSTIKVFELPDVSNTTGILDYTKYFFKVVFEVAKERLLAGNPVRICVAIEEAHTVIPEWNFAGSSDKTSQSLVNTISQIALQGRKYGVGFMIITQRTANVSKTILTQCNTVICFKAFDDTSFTFVGNHIGKELVKTLPRLKQYHAVVTGKAIKSNLPIIVDLKR
ncbi:hypothetical protein SAMN05192566_1021 [Methylophilus rhizosphaerae]|uniref:Helicase HerA central domain-containing protein n=1 Tax=Methylophilus rhizosphaerae TaxID=492660 RepID=A0A1G9B8G1_9PROT|nr:ATP-binding protein [Methylophilus rhizosphaerae]SDK35310.1 hypothetical protein SAMN05192566_1021 [Methylophilus rhizosphaerae]